MRDDMTFQEWWDDIGADLHARGNGPQAFRLFDATGRRRYDGTLAECQAAARDLARWDIYVVHSTGALGSLVDWEGR